MKKLDTFNPYRLFVGSFIPNVIMKYKKLSSTAKLVYGRLCQYAGKDGECFPAQTTLALEVAISTRQVYSCLKELEKEGFIAVIKSSGKDKLFHLHNKYVFLKHPILFESEENFRSRQEENFHSGDEANCRVRESFTKENHAKEGNLEDNCSERNNLRSEQHKHVDPLYKNSNPVKPIFIIGFSMDSKKFTTPKSVSQDELIKFFEESYSRIDIWNEFSHAAAWLVAHPETIQSVEDQDGNYFRFLTKWFQNKENKIQKWAIKYNRADYEPNSPYEYQ